MLPQQYCLRWKYHHSNLQTMFSQLLDRGCFCDVTLACEGQMIRAHRVVLCACSTFFDTVLTNYASERDPIIIMKDVTFADVKCLIEFMYKGEINVEHAHLASLLKTADDLKIKGLAEVSWREDDDGPPPPMPATAFYSPTRPLDHYAHEQLHVAPSPERGHEQDYEQKSVSPVPPKAHTRLPTLTPIPTASGISMAASPPVDHYLGPKRKRGRPPLDDAYDVFNVRKIAQFAAEQLHHQSLMEARHTADEMPQQSRLTNSPNPNCTAAAAAAYQHHIHQQQTKQRIRQRQHQPETEESDHVDHTDPEWITSNLEVNVAECESTANENGNDDGLTTEIKEQLDRAAQDNEECAAPKKTHKRNRERSSEHQERAPTHRTVRKISKEKHEHNGDTQRQAEGADLHAADSHAAEEAEQETVPQPVEEIESVHKVRDQKASTASNLISATSHANASSTTHKNSARLSPNATAQTLPPLAPPPLHHSRFGKYAPEGYLLNEHGMLMTHDFVHAHTASIPTAASTAAAGAACMATANGSDQEFVDIKMEEYDAAEMRLTSEEMSQWQDVIKMDDYLAKGRRPQFWEEPFTRRVLDAIKNKRLEMKKAARILGVSYGTLYGRYREVYGCLKHPYSNAASFRPSQSNPLGVPPRYDFVWSSPKRDNALQPAPLEIGKIRPKDLSELWTRPQI